MTPPPDRTPAAVPLLVRAHRLHRGDDLRAACEAWCDDVGVANGFVLSCVGSLSEATLRMAGADRPEHRRGPFELVALSGTLAPGGGGGGAHLHALLSAADGTPWAGHVSAGCVVATTVELVVGIGDGLRFRRLPDASTGYPELEIEGP